MDQKPLDHLRCVVERITYQSDGYSVLKCAAKGYNDFIAVVGMMPDTHVGSVLTVGGHWKIDSKYGRQFEVVTFEENRLRTIYNTKALFQPSISLAVDGIEYETLLKLEEVFKKPLTVLLALLLFPILSIVRDPYRKNRRYSTR